MDLRFEKRHHARLEAVLLDLNRPMCPVRATLSDVSKSGISVLSASALAPKTVVKLTLADSTLFGYIVYSNPEGSAFRTGVKIESVIIGGTDLAQLLRSILEREMPLVPGIEPVLPA